MFTLVDLTGKFLISLSHRVLNISVTLLIKFKALKVIKMITRLKNVNAPTVTAKVCYDGKEFMFVPQGCLILHFHLARRDVY